jgi:hypothetical protein
MKKCLKFKGKNLSDNFSAEIKVRKIDPWQRRPRQPRRGRDDDGAFERVGEDLGHLVVADEAPVDEEELWSII